MNHPYSIAIDDQENYVYVSDSGNNRIQRFPLH
jgi:DNA-binding beta-propeller fold protein YncE